MKVYRQPPHDHLLWLGIAVLLIFWILWASDVLHP